MLRFARLVPRLGQPGFQVARNMASAADFEEAQKRLNTLTEEPDNMVKLKIYGLFKQATVGDAGTDRPSAINFVARAKYDSWAGFKGISQEDARAKYIALIDELAQAGPAVPEPVEPGQVAGLKTGPDGDIYRIHLNRPSKFNAITAEMYVGILEALYKSKEDKSTKITVFSAAGPYYCSGNDLKAFLQMNSPDKLKPMAEEAARLMVKFVASFIDHDKPLIALVQGPAIGIAVTTLALFDVVICSDQATFQTPFTALGYSPEGCSSLTFPKIMGTSKANEILLFGRTITAQEAYDWGLVSRVIPQARFEEETAKYLQNLCQLPAESLRINKKMVRDLTRADLHKANESEAQLICERWQGKDCAEAFKKFMSRKK